MSKTTAKGVTMVELLLVVVLVGILSGVVITVIRPRAQENKVRDGNIQSTLDKIALAVQSYVSAYGRVPDEKDFIALLTNATAKTLDCNTNADYECAFSVSNNALQTDQCGADGYTAGAGQCYFVYTGTANTLNFVLRAKAYSTNLIYVYDSTTGQITLQ